MSFLEKTNNILLIAVLLALTLSYLFLISPALTFGWSELPHQPLCLTNVQGVYRGLVLYPNEITIRGSRWEPRGVGTDINLMEHGYTIDDAYVSMEVFMEYESSYSLHVQTGCNPRMDKWDGYTSGSVFEGNTPFRTAECLGIQPGTWNKIRVKVTDMYASFGGSPDDVCGNEINTIKSIKMFAGENKSGTLQDMVVRRITVEVPYGQAPATTTTTMMVTTTTQPGMPNIPDDQTTTVLILGVIVAGIILVDKIK